MSDEAPGDAVGERAYRRGFRDKGNKREDGMAAISLILFLTGGSAGTGWLKVKRADRYSMLVELVLLAVFLGVLGSAARPITSGHFAPLVWGGLVGIGLVIPLLIDFVGYRVKALSAVAAALVLAGGFVLRYVALMSMQS
jgi:polysulfide reductase chain C